MKCYLFVLLFAVSLIVSASPVDRASAAKTARAFLGVQLQDTPVNAKARMAENDRPAYYVFNAEDNRGFVIVSGDDEFPSILGYSFNGTFSDDDVNPALQSLLDAFSEYVVEVQAGRASVSAAAESEGATPVVGPLLKAEWGQGLPYNFSCPKIDGKRCVVGCVATAVSQILHYWRWPEQGKGKLTYTPDGSAPRQTVDFSQQTYNWDLMKNTKIEINSDSSYIKEVGKLCYHCGVAARMGYGLESSGTYNQYLVQGLYSYFRYRASTLKILYRDCTASQEEWVSVMKNELNEGRPILYSGVDSRNGGHSFVIDGYDSRDYFHVNWGWDGSNNGYFNPAVLDAFSGASFTENMSMVIGIEPDRDGTDTISNQIKAYLYTAPVCKGISSGVNLGSKTAYSIEKLLNYYPQSCQWKFGVGLYDQDGNFISNVRKLSLFETSDTITVGGLYFSSVSTSIAIPKTCQDGYYYIKALFTQVGFDDWENPDVVGGEENNKIYLKVENGKAYFNQVPAAIEDISASMEPVSVNYYTIQGQKASSSSKGIIIKKVKNADGTVIVKKIFKK